MNTSAQSTFQKLILNTKDQYLEDISNWLNINKALCITLEDNKDDPIYEPEPNTLPIWEDIKISALFDQEVNLDILISKLNYHFSKDIIENYEYATIEFDNKISKYDFEPIDINNNKLWLYPYDKHPDLNNPKESNRVYINIEPGLAFGSGEHPTTVLCLQWLSNSLNNINYINHTDNTNNFNIIDYGCGSGILSLAASKLINNISNINKITQIYAIDNDPQAITSTLENAKRNKIKNITALEPVDFSKNYTDIKADIIVANILANTLIELSDIIIDKLKPGGKFALSGILEHQVNEVALTYINKGAKITAITTKGAWVSIEGLKNNQSNT